MVEAEKTGLEGLRRSTHHLEAYLYDNDGLIAPMWAIQIQKAFVVLANLFECVGLRNNVHKTVSMVCQPCHYLCGMSIDAYTLRITGGWRGGACIGSAYDSRCSAHNEKGSWLLGPSRPTPIPSMAWDGGVQTGQQLPPPSPHPP